MWGLMMLLVALIGGVAVHSTPMLSSPPSSISALGRPAGMVQAQARAVADNLVLAMHEAATACVEQASPTAVCSGSSNYSSSNTGGTGAIGTNITGQRDRIPMMSAAGSPQGRIYMLRSGMYLVTTWAPPAGSSTAYQAQVCALAAAYLRDKLGGADWVGTYDAPSASVRIWFGVGLPGNVTGTRTNASVAIPVTPQTGMTTGCPAYVEPIQN